jgi:hypothetical protein
MPDSSLDTSQLARELEAAGFPPDQARTMSAATAKAFVAWYALLGRAIRDDHKLRIPAKADSDSD